MLTLTSLAIKRADNLPHAASRYLKRNLRSTYCTIEATERHEASRGLSAPAGLLVTVQYGVSVRGDNVPGDIISRYYPIV